MTVLQLEMFPFCNALIIHVLLNFRALEIFWMNNKQLLNSAFIWYKISNGVIRLKSSADNTLLDLHNSSYDTQPRPVIANHTTLSSRLKPNRWISGLFMVIKVARNSFKHLHFDVSL